MERNSQGWTVLHLATWNMQREIVRKLLQSPKASQLISEPNHQFDGVTALHFAALNGDEEVVSLLLNSGAKISIRTSSGTRFNYAQDVVGKLLSNAEPNIEAGGQNGQTPISCAAQNGHVDVVKVLLNAEANIREGRDSE